MTSRRSRSLAVVLTLAAVTAALAAGAVHAAAPTPLQATPQAPNRPVRLVVGWVLLGHHVPADGATVRVTTLDGADVTEQPAHVGASGTFSVKVTRLPYRFLVVASGGPSLRRGETLKAAVTSYARFRLVDVNPVSTLVATCLLHHPKRPYEASAREVKRHLGIPGFQTVGGAVRVPTPHFDVSRYVQEARRTGTLATFTTALDKEIERGAAPRSFRGLTPAPAPRVTQVFGRVQTSQAAALDPAGIALDLLAELAAAAGKAAGDKTVGWILSSLGFGGEGVDLTPMENELTQIEATQEQILQELTGLQTQLNAVQAQIAQSEFSTLVGQLGGLGQLGTPSDPIATDLLWLASNAVGCQGTLAGCVPSIPGTDALVWCNNTAATTDAQTVACDAIELIDKLATSQTQQIPAIGGTSTGADGIVTAAGRSLYQSIKAGGGFVTYTYLDQLTSVFQYYAQQEAVLAQYLTEYDHAKGLPDTRVLQPLTTAQTAIGGQTSLLPNPLPRNTWIDTRSGRMWIQPIADNSVGNGECTDANSVFVINIHVQSPSADCQRVLQAVFNSDGLVWNTPAVSDIQALLAGSSGPPATWLSQQVPVPDITSIDSYTSVPVPAPDRSQLPASYANAAAWPTLPNPGTVAGWATYDCSPGIRWDTGFDDSGGPIFINATLCSYVRAADGQRVAECVGWLNSYPCSTPIGARQYGRAQPSGALDFGHPLTLLMWRSPQSAEFYFVS